VRVLADGQTDRQTHTHRQTQTDFIICPMRVLADGQTDRQTHTHRQTQTDFIICPMLYAIAVGEITRCSAIAERPRCRVHYSFRQK